MSIENEDSVCETESRCREKIKRKSHVMISTSPIKLTMKRTMERVDRFVGILLFIPFKIASLGFYHNSCNKSTDSCTLCMRRWLYTLTNVYVFLSDKFKSRYLHYKRSHSWEIAFSMSNRNGINAESKEYQLHGWLAMHVSNALHSAPINNSIGIARVHPATTPVCQM